MLPLLESDIVNQYYLMLSQSISGQVSNSLHDSIMVDINLIAKDNNVNYYLFCEEVGRVSQFESKGEIVEYMIKTSYRNVMFWGYVSQDVKDKLMEWC